MQTIKFQNSFFTGNVKGEVIKPWLRAFWMVVEFDGGRAQAVVCRQAKDGTYYHDGVWPCRNFASTEEARNFIHSA